MLQKLYASPAIVVVHRDAFQVYSGLTLQTVEDISTQTANFDQTWIVKRNGVDLTLSEEEVAAMLEKMEANMEGK